MHSQSSGAVDGDGGKILPQRVLNSPQNRGQMHKKACIFFALFAAICALIACVQILWQMEHLQNSLHKENVRKEAIGAAKEAIDALYLRAQEECKNTPQKPREEIINSLIAEQNAQGKRLYAFDAAGFYTAHYNRFYLGDNAYFERDENGRHYMQELASSNGSYTEAIIPWQGKKRHIITYARTDAKSGVNIGATVDLSQIAQLPSRELAAQKRWMVWAAFAIFCALLWRIIYRAVNNLPHC